MKRTKYINRDNFRKNWRAYQLAPIALAVSAVLSLSGCEQADVSVTLFKNAEECTQANPNMRNECTKSFGDALAEAEKTAPKYASLNDCVAEFGTNQCTEVPAAQAGVAQSSGGSIWMPLMAGYMFGRLTGGSMAHSPLFTSNSPASPARGRFVDAAGNNYGSATTGRTTTVNKTALAPKPATTTTITRGGFGQTVAKQTAMQRSSTTSSSTRSNGG